MLSSELESFAIGGLSEADSRFHIEFSELRGRLSSISQVAIRMGFRKKQTPCFLLVLYDLSQSSIK
jgi:hypothetical protein